MRTTSSKPNARRRSALTSMVALFTELLRLNPMRGVVPSGRENSFAIISVHSTE